MPRTDPSAGPTYRGDAGPASTDRLRPEVRRHACH
jgi:hypothetical protein